MFSLIAQVKATICGGLINYNVKDLTDFIGNRDFLMCILFVWDGPQIEIAADVLANTVGRVMMMHFGHLIPIQRWLGLPPLVSLYLLKLHFDLSINQLLRLLEGISLSRHGSVSPFIWRVLDFNRGNILLLKVHKRDEFPFSLEYWHVRFPFIDLLDCLINLALSY